MNFLFKCLDKYGRKASVLFNNIDFGENKSEYINILITKYSTKFDFHFINFEFLKSIYEQQNEVLQKQLENQQSMTNEMKRIKYDYNNDISNLKNEMSKMKDEYNNDIAALKEMIEQLKESQKQQEKMQKQREEILLKRIEKLEENQKEFDAQKKSFETLIEEQNSKISQYEMQKQEIEDNKNTIEINYIKGNEFNGINNYLNQISGGNSHDKGVINITANSCNGDYAHPKCLIDYNNNNYFHSRNDILNIEICFDFKDKLVQLSNYTIKSYDCGPNSNHLRNWVIEVSNDNIIWETADERNNDSHLNDRYVVATFSTKKLTGFYRFVRLRQTGKNWYNQNYMIFDAFEFFGKLKFPK